MKRIAKTEVVVIRILDRSTRSDVIILKCVERKHIIHFTFLYF